MKKYLPLLLLATIMLASCEENYSTGERIGFITKFSEKGVVYKTWEGHLNQTQTGMNTADGFDFSIDGDNPDQTLVDKIKAAADSGFKVRLKYHQVWGFKNVFGERGHTDYFITDCTALSGRIASVKNDPIAETIYAIFIAPKPAVKLPGVLEGSGGTWLRYQTGATKL